VSAIAEQRIDYEEEIRQFSSKANRLSQARQEVLAKLETERMLFKEAEEEKKMRLSQMGQMSQKMTALLGNTQRAALVSSTKSKESFSAPYIPPAKSGASRSGSSYGTSTSQDPSMYKDLGGRNLDLRHNKHDQVRKSQESPTKLKSGQQFKARGPGHEMVFGQHTYAEPPRLNTKDKLKVYTLPLWQDDSTSLKSAKKTASVVSDQSGKGKKKKTKKKKKKGSSSSSHQVLENFQASGTRSNSASPLRQSSGSVPTSYRSQPTSGREPPSTSRVKSKLQAFMGSVDGSDDDDDSNSLMTWYVRHLLNPEFEQIVRITA
jgi:hypothetical protein